MDLWMVNICKMKSSGKYGGILIQGRWNYYSKLKKEKLKTKKLLKITILDEQEPSVQSADSTDAVQVWSWGKRYSAKPGNWPSQYLGISENK